MRIQWEKKRRYIGRKVIINYREQRVSKAAFVNSRSDIVNDACGSASINDCCWRGSACDALYGTPFPVRCNGGGNFLLVFRWRNCAQRLLQFAVPDDLCDVGHACSPA
jgi:hypothetical protein